jgi:hypothetical protein
MCRASTPCGNSKGVNGRDKPGHDEATMSPCRLLTVAALLSDNAKKKH